MTNVQRFAALKKQVGGNREVLQFEDTFGRTREEAAHITPPPRCNVRILSELEFALGLSKELNGKFDSLIAQALNILEKGMEESGVLTKQAADAAEQILMPLSADAKSYKLILAGHAHIDMNWMWSWTETVAATIATFQTMLKVMEEYPQFCFSQSQTSVYALIDEYAPELHDQIKARIDEGRWEVTASSWVETDKNMPSTSSLLHHISCTKKYLNEKWGIPAEKLDLDFSPDTFGHSANLAELDRFGGVKYYYHCRGFDGEPALYRWKGQSGKEMLVYREQFWYNSAITPRPAMKLFEISRRSGGLKTGLVVYGVGDHGGGPTRRDVERGIEMMAWPIFPTIQFGTFHDYFHEAEKVWDKLTVIDYELNFTFPGCYTTQSRLKRGNRRCEAALNEADNAMAFAHTELGTPLHKDAIEKAWQKVLFTHFHDILTGSCVQDSREYGMGLYQDALATANTEIGLAFGKLSAAIDTSMVVTEDDPSAQAPGAGVGYNIDGFATRGGVERGCGKVRLWNIFNNTYTDRYEPVEITCWDWMGDLRFAQLKDVKGNPLEFQLLDQDMVKYWDHMYFRFLVYVKVPALSYTTVVLSEKEMDEYPAYRGNCRNRYPDEDYVLDNGLIRCTFDFHNGAMISMKDLGTGREYVANGQVATLELIKTNRHNSSAWDIGSHLGKIPVTDLSHIHQTDNGPLRWGISYEAAIANSKVTVTYTLDKGAKAIKMNIHADWNEVAGEQVPVFAYEWPVAYDTDAFRYNVPAGSTVRQSANDDRPGLSYVAALDRSDKLGAAIITDCKYGFRATRENGTAHLYSTLINSAGSPDPYPERGIHEIVLTLGILNTNPAEMEKTAAAVNRPMTFISTVSHKGTLAPEGSFLQMDTPDIVVSSIEAGDDYLDVCAYSTADENRTLAVTRTGIQSAQLIDLAGNIIGKASVESGKAQAVIAPKCLAILRLFL